MERVVGFEPTLTGWKPIALPLGYTRKKLGADEGIRTPDINVGNVTFYH